MYNIRQKEWSNQKRQNWQGPQAVFAKIEKRKSIATPQAVSFE